MRPFLFPTLTRRSARGGELFAALVAEARKTHWFVEGEVPDTIDGRFAVLASVLALAIVRLERGGEQAGTAAVALTERFVEAMDAEHRQIGLGDPSIGKHVRKLVTALGRRVQSWRQVVDGAAPWDEEAVRSVYREAPSLAALEQTSGALHSLWDRLAAASDADLAEGALG